MTEKVQNNQEEIFLIGSKWVYLKLYTSPLGADSVLVQFISPLLMELKKKNTAIKFFFIRYYDPNFHIRLRIELRSSQCFNSFFNTLHAYIKPFVENKSIWNIICDTYRPEYERYGRNTINEVESIFHSNSENIITLLNKLQHSQDKEQDRWLYAIYYIDKIYNQLQFTTEEKMHFSSSMATTFLTEFNITNKKQLNDKYRSYSPIILNTLAGNESIIKRIVAEMNTVEFSYVSYLMTYYNNDRSQLDRIIQSIIHMTINRVFRTRNRLCELTLYYLLSKHYNSTINQRRYNNNLINS